MQGLYLEEFEVGRKFVHGLRRTVTEMDNTLFSCHRAVHQRHIVQVIVATHSLETGIHAWVCFN